MGVDYYGVFKLRKTASEDEIKRAYQKLAMKWHPDVHRDEDKETANNRFKSITIAYEVLADAQKRRRYDEAGESALVDLQAGIRDVNVVFKEVFGFASPLDLDAEKALSFQDKLEKVFNSALEVSSKPEITCKAPPIECKLLCSLQDLYNGCRKKVKITKNQIDTNGRMIPVEETLTVEVQPGWRAGTKVTFPGKGNDKEGMLPSDVVFLIEEKPHEVMKRKGDDLIVVMKVALVDALTGYTAQVNTLDGRILMVPCVEVLTPASEVIVKDEGMPVYTSSHPSTSHDYISLHNQETRPTGNRKRKGDLRVHFDIVFPAQLSALQKAAIHHALTEMK